VLSDETKRRAYDGGSGSVRSSFNAGGAAPGSSFTSQEYGTASEEAQHAPHVQAWYVGQKEVSRHQEFFYEKTVASEQRCVCACGGRRRACFRSVLLPSSPVSLSPPPPPPTRGAARQIKAANAIKIIPQSRGRSMLWLATPVFIAALWGFNTMSARNTRKMHNR
jgi:hypothetical protein